MSALSEEVRANGSVTMSMCGRWTEVAQARPTAGDGPRAGRRGDPGDRAHRYPAWVAWAFSGYGRAFAENDALRAPDKYRQGLSHAREHRTPCWGALIAHDGDGNCRSRLPWVVLSNPSASAKAP
jgi:hypothetical protein